MSSPRLIPLSVVRGSVDAAGPEPLRCPLPLPSQALPAGRRLAVIDDQGRAVDAQVSVLARWPDGSAKWLLIECAAPPGASDLAWFAALDGPPSGSAPELGRIVSRGVELTSSDMALRVYAGDAIEVVRQGRPTAHLTLECTDADDGTTRVAFDSVSLEWNGSQRATALARGRATLSGAAVNLDLRISTYSANSQIRCDLTIHNPRRARHEGNCWELGDPGSVLFKRLAVVLRTASSGTDVCSFVSDTPGAWEPGSVPVSLYQESSGGPRWDSRTHVDRSGAVPMKRRGYVVQGVGCSREGLRAEPAVQLEHADGSWAVTLLRFWEEFPSALAIVSADCIAVEPFPGSFPALHELQGGERKTRTCIFTHGERGEARSALLAALRPSSVRPDVSHLRGAAVLPFLDAAQDPRHERLLERCLEGPASFGAKRERMDEYGWRNFGDLVADHESAFLTDGHEFVSHYNNQYDAVFGFGVQFLRTGDRRWWELMDDLARHVGDIDIYHTTEDKAAYNGGMFWHTYHYLDAGKSSHRSYPRAAGVPGGGPAAEQNYSAGLALHYFLTGWIPSREAAIGLARWVIDMDDGGNTPFQWFSREHTGLATASGNPRYHGPGRAGGNSIHALLVGFELTDDRAFLHKAEGLIRRCIHPDDDIAALNLLDAERRWYYTVFLESVGRYLWCKAVRDELDSAYEYARRALLHYARWMREHEYPYLDRPEILEYPTETWSAQDIRKSEVLAWAALCERGTERDAFLESSKRFRDDVLNRLPAFPSCGYTRPLVLMLARGYAYNWAIAHPEVYFAPAPGVTSFPPSSHFEPQKVVAIRRAKRAVAVTTAAAAGAAALLLLA